MAFDEAWNFRNTLAFATDGTDEQFDGSDNVPHIYPYTAGGVTYGWANTGNLQPRDRNSGLDRRLAGMVYMGANSLVRTFRVDLPATGDYQLYLAIGEPNYGKTHYFRFLDNTTALLTFAGETTAASHWLDTQKTDHNGAAAWVANNQPVTYTFSSTIFIMEIGWASGTPDSAVAHLRLVQVQASGVSGRKAWFGLEAA